MIRVAVVGTGGIAGVCHMPALRAEAHRAEVVAVADVDLGRAWRFAREHGVPHAYSSVAELLQRERPDLVHLCTPPGVHAVQAIECLKSGAWVWIEKPACRSLAEWDAITAAEGPGYASVVSQHRFGSGAVHLKEIAPLLGRPLVAQCVTTWFRDHDYFTVPWRGRFRTEGGGPTVGHAIHQIDVMLSILGDWAEVSATTATLDRDVEYEDVAMATVRFTTGALASVVTSLLSRREESYLRFDFTDATVELRHLYGYRNENWTATTDLWQPPDDRPSSHEAQLAALLDAYQKDERPPMSARQGRQALELATGIYASAHRRRPVTRAELTPDDPFYHRLDGGAWTS
ncbi:Gfo/Idh/MocA family oxidoreductase [Herbidospora sp. NEAU-GS84]|uniref:Gfo/Idh/MocA family oxidoreductase n=1 Tax=Herbidospora solisilvae TaxID=2696284 RepID=A0A7C9J148_9ACTN|nr:Gfo/Idh/MocA family oxidoreductase [Herbidospora solisilvae]NAS21542.1 Gfo/Idh/MocA family oxidoreductase [Herbidospora solisilvae]